MSGTTRLAVGRAPSRVEKENSQVAWFRGPALVALLLALAALAPAPDGSRAVAAMATAFPQRAAAATRSPAARMAGLPLTFERNDGQVSSPVKYLARGPGYTLFLTAQGATLVLARPVSMGHGAAVLGGRQAAAGLGSGAGPLSRSRMAEAVLRLTPLGMGKAEIIGTN